MQVEGVEAENFPLILIYYKFRGQLQPIRNLLCYLQIPFIEVHPECLEEERRHLPYRLCRHICKFKINRSQLPALIHGNVYAEGPMTICTYICKKFNRIELLGTNITIRCKLQEALELFLIHHPKSLLKIMACVDQIVPLSEAETHKHVKLLFQDIMRNTKYSRPMCEYLALQKDPTYIFGQPTIIDFFFMETCYYTKGMFDSPERLDLEDFHPKASNQVVERTKNCVYYLEIMKKYLKNMRSQPWYLKHQKYLQSFTMNCVCFTKERMIGLRKIWLGDLRQVG